MLQAGSGVKRTTARRMARKIMNKRQITLLAMTGTLLPVVPSLADDLAEKHEEKSLRAKLANSEAQIASLQQRVEQLEKRLQALITPAMPARQISAAGHTDNLPQISSSFSRTPPATEESRSAAKKGGDAPGTFEVDEAAAQRALERTLTQAGALLLPAGTFELTPRTFRKPFMH
jgi:TolA-binding protein